MTRNSTITDDPDIIIYILVNRLQYTIYLLSVHGTNESKLYYKSDVFSVDYGQTSEITKIHYKIIVDNYSASTG
jgi:hypothetical protein